MNILEDLSPRNLDIELRDLDLTTIADNRVRAIESIDLTGSGDKAFVAGADIAEMADYDPLDARAFSHFGQDMLSAIEACPKVVIAMIQGYALGGGLDARAMSREVDPELYRHRKNGIET